MIRKRIEYLQRKVALKASVIGDRWSVIGDRWSVSHKIYLHHDHTLSYSAMYGIWLYFEGISIRYIHILKISHQLSYGFQNLMSGWGCGSKILKEPRVGDFSFLCESIIPHSLYQIKYAILWFSLFFCIKTLQSVVWVQFTDEHEAQIYNYRLL